MSERYQRMYCDDHGIYDSRGFCPHCKIADLEQQLASKWIPVGERLPRRGDMVLTTDSEGRVLRSYMQEHGRFEISYLCEPHYHVTRWQPLPAPPKEGGQ